MIARVLRGGSWYVVSGNLRASYRIRHGPAFVYGNIGFLAVLGASQGLRGGR